jgi:hypothetical protein
MGTATAKHRTSGHALPDVNAETYPFDVVQRLLDQTADLLVYAVPDEAHADAATLTPDDPTDYFGLNGGYGLDLKSTLHRFRSATHSPADQAVGEVVGSFRGLWLFCPDDAGWAADRHPPPALFDPFRPQRFAVQRAEFAFAGCKERLRGYGMGRTYPVDIDGRPATLAGAVGTVVEGEGRARGLEGTFVMTGAVTEELGFRGVITCRLVDPKGAIRGGRELPKWKQAAVPTHGSTFVVVRGEKRDRTVKTTYGPPPNDTQVSLVTPTVMREIEFAASAGGGRLRTGTKFGPPVGEFTATVAFDVTAPPGTTAAPVPFTTDEEYTFRDEDGNVVGTVRAAVAEGHSFGLTFPATSGQPGVRFGGVGPVLGGTGCFAGVKGMLGVNSLIGIAPHALSLVHTLHLIAPRGGHPVRAGKAGNQMRQGTRVRSREDDLYEGVVDRIREHTNVHLSWRAGFRRCGDAFALAVASAFNAHRLVGQYPTIHVSSDELAAKFQEGVQRPFGVEKFDKFDGRAKAVFRTYELASGRELGTSVLYSYWEKTRAYEDIYIQRITGSDSAYYTTHELPPCLEGNVDLLANTFRDHVGIVGWVSFYQHGRQEASSIAYEAVEAGVHQVLWISRVMTRNMRPYNDGVFRFSLEWRSEDNGKPCYDMVAMFFEIDFEQCSIKVHGDTFWKARYIEEPANNEP